MGRPAVSIPEVLLFDLGGVLVESLGLSALPRLLPMPMAPADLRRKWIESPSVAQFETGRCTESQFAAAFIEEWDLRLSEGEFLAEFDSWVTGPYRETAELVARLDGRYTLACLSNTNALHWRKLQQM